MTTKHIKRIGLNCSEIAILLVFISCGNDTRPREINKKSNKIETVDRLREINEMRSKGVVCNGIGYEKEDNLSRVDNCLEDTYTYNSSIRVEKGDVLKSLDNDLDCTYLFGKYVQYASFDNDLINTCGNPPLDQ